MVPLTSSGSLGEAEEQALLKVWLSGKLHYLEHRAVSAGAAGG